MTIKYSESLDGINWSDPVIALQESDNSAAWDYTHCETPTVIKNPDPLAPPGKKYLMYYSGANKDIDAPPNKPGTYTYYQIGLAYSDNGSSFNRISPGIDNKPGLVLEPDAALFGNGLPGNYGEGIVADPEVVYQNGIYHMWFTCMVETAGGTFLALGICHAISNDGISWIANHNNPLSSLSRSGTGSGQQPGVLYNSDTHQYEMWFSNDTDAEKATVPCSYNTVNGFFHATSDDGINWNADYTARDILYSKEYSYESLGFLTGIEVILVNGKYYMFYSAWGTEQIPDGYECPDQYGGNIPGVLTLNTAVK